MPTPDPFPVSVVKHVQVVGVKVIELAVTQQTDHQCVCVIL